MEKVYVSGHLNSRVVRRWAQRQCLAELWLELGEVSPRMLRETAHLPLLDKLLLGRLW